MKPVASNVLEENTAHYRMWDREELRPTMHKCDLTGLKSFRKAELNEEAHEIVIFAGYNAQNV